MCIAVCFCFIQGNIHWIICRSIYFFIRGFFRPKFGCNCVVTIVVEHRFALLEFKKVLRWTTLGLGWIGDLVDGHEFFLSHASLRFNAFRYFLFITHSQIHAHVQTALWDDGLLIFAPFGFLACLGAFCDCIIPFVILFDPLQARFAFPSGTLVVCSTNSFLHLCFASFLSQLFNIHLITSLSLQLCFRKQAVVNWNFCLDFEIFIVFWQTIFLHNFQVVFLFFCFLPYIGCLSLSVKICI